MRTAGKQRSEPVVASRGGTALVARIVSLAPRRSLSAKAGTRLLRAARSALVARKDRPIHITIDGTRLLAPLSHDLPIYRAMCPEYSRNFGAVVGEVAGGHSHLTVVDIGANIGDSVAIGGRHANVSYLCIEGSERFFPFLEANLGGRTDVTLVNAMVGTPGMSLIIETKQGTGAAISFSTGPTSAVQTLEEIIDTHCGVAPSSHLLVKSDTDGLDATILLGSESVFKVLRPDLFFEFDPVLSDPWDNSPLDVISMLVDLEYPTFTAWDNLGYRLLRVDRADAMKTFTDLAAYCRSASERLLPATAYLDVWVEPNRREA